MVFGFWHVSMTPKINSVYFGTNQMTQNNSWKSRNVLGNYSFGKSQLLGNRKLIKFGKGGAWKILKVRLTFVKILNIGSISSNKHEMEARENLEYGINIFQQKHGMGIWY